VTATSQYGVRSVTATSQYGVRSVTATSQYGVEAGDGNNVATAAGRRDGRRKAVELRQGRCLVAIADAGSFTESTVARYPRPGVT